MCVAALSEAATICSRRRPLCSHVCGVCVALTPRLVQGVARILKPKGYFLCVSVGIPSERLPILENQDYSWKVTAIPLQKPVANEKGSEFDPEGDPVGVHWLYVCRTGGDDDEG